MQTNLPFPPHPDLLFLEAIRRRRTPFTILFMVANLVVFLLMEFWGGTTNEATLVEFGAKSNPDIAQGEIWRFITPVFIHIGLLHLVFNSYALWIVGQQVERLYGSARFVLLYGGAGFTGVLGSYLYHPDGLSAGASGAIFGLFGVLLVFGIRNRRTIPAFLGRAIGRGILPLIVINLAIGFAIPVIDNAAHIGGLLGGMLLAGLVGYSAPGSQTPVLARAGQYLVLGTILISFQQVYANYDGPPFGLSGFSSGWQARLGSVSAAEQFIEIVNESQSAFTASDRALRGRSNPEALERTYLRLESSLGELERVPYLTVESDERVKELRRVMESQVALVGEIRTAGRISPAQLEALDQSRDAWEQAQAALLDWVRTQGGRFGLSVGSGE